MIAIFEIYFSHQCCPDFFNKTNLLRRLPTYVKKILGKKKQKQKGQAGRQLQAPLVSQVDNYSSEQGRAVPIPGTVKSRLDFVTYRGRLLSGAK
jgi:hypothetical protein